MCLVKRSRNILISCLIILIGTLLLSSCAKRYEGEYSSVNGSFVGKDALGRSLVYDLEVREGRYVGLFYFLWQGQHGTGGPYDNNKIFTEHPEALLSEEAWLSYGGGPLGAHHFWGEPLFGYYTSDDEWVMRKHVQMLTDAGIDFLVFDTTNTYTYDEQALKLFKILDEYYQQGYNVPKFAYYTHTHSTDTIKKIYYNIYKKYPEYDHLWFYWEGKPLIIGDPYIGSEVIEDFFRIKEDQWPNSFLKEDGFPWMSFTRPQHIFKNEEGEAEVVSVSMAQHPSLYFSLSAFYGKESGFYTRSYHNGKNDPKKDALLYGYNFAEQFEFAIEADPKIIFVTGWNEWVAQRQAYGSASDPISFVDCADPNNSRDAEPMRGGFYDNYYLQMANYIRLYKGSIPRVDVGPDLSIDIKGDFDQWEEAKAVYKDYTNDIVDRDALGFGDIHYTNDTGRNDFDLLKAAKDKNNIYFYVKTVDDISEIDGENWMNLFINTGKKTRNNWMGYNFRVKTKGNKLVLERRSNKSWKIKASLEFKLEGNQMMIKIPKSKLGIGKSSLIDIQFKWADNTALDDVFSFYSDGDVAPYGRLNYLFSEKE